jgi:hypothetical protein
VRRTILEYAGPRRCAQGPMAGVVGDRSRLGLHGHGVMLVRCSRSQRAPMSEPHESSLFIPLRTSRQLGLAFAGLHLGAIACALANSLPLEVRLLVVICVALSAWNCIRLHATGGAARAIVLIVWDRQGQWRLVQRNGRVLDAWLAHGAYSHPSLTALPFVTRGGRRRCVVIVGDRVDAEQMRRLRVRLRCTSGGRGGPGAVC